MPLCIIADRTIPGADAYPLDPDDFTFAAPLRLDPIASAIIARMTVEPNDFRKKTINNLVLGLKTNLLAKADVLHIYAAHDAQAARLNWAGTSYNAVVGGTPTFDDDYGYRMVANGDYLDSGFNPNTAPTGKKFLQNDAGLGVWVLNNLAVSTRAIGYSVNPRAAQLFARSTANFLQGRINTDNATELQATVSTSAGWSMAHRTSSTAQRLSRNGVDQVAGSATSAAPSNAVITIGGTTATTTGQHFAVAYIGGALTQAEDAAAYAALSTYLSAVGAI